MYEKSRIVGIDIVYVGDSVDDYVFEVEKVKTVSDTASFISAFEKLSCYLIYTAPKGIQSDSMAIKIIYDNGNYEIVGDGGAAYFIQSKVEVLKIIMVVDTLIKMNSLRFYHLTFLRMVDPTCQNPRRVRPPRMKKN